MSDAALRPVMLWCARRFYTSPRQQMRLTGGLCGLYLLVWCHAFLDTWGTSLPVVAGLAAGLTLGVEVAWWRWSRWRRPLSGVGRIANPSEGRADGLAIRPTTDFAARTEWPPFVTHLGLAGWTVALPWLSDGWSAVVARVPVETLASPPVTWAVLIAGGVGLLSVPAFLLTSLGLSSPDARGTADEPAASFERFRVWLGGLGWGLLFGVFIVAPTAGLQIGASAAAIAGACVAFVHLVRGERTWASRRAPQKAASPANPIATAATGMSVDFRTAVWAAAVCALLGVFFAAGQRIAHQLMPAAAYTLAAQWAILLLSTGWGIRQAQQRLLSGASPRQIDTAACLRTAVAFAAIPLCYRLLIDISLLLNSHVASVWMLMAARGAIAGLIVAPAGTCLGAMLARMFSGVHGERAAEDASSSATAAAPTRLFALCASFAAGFVIARLAMQQAADAAAIAIAASALLTVLAAARGLRDVLAPRAWQLRMAIAAACVVPVVAIVFHRADDSARAARLLFSTNVFLAKQAGLNPRLLTALDEGRLVAVREGVQATHTLWTYRGVQYQLRESGIPRAVVSGDGRICPQYPPEVMQAVLPLVLHERPSRVLVLGLGSGVPLATCLRFPVLEVAYADGDHALTALLETHVWGGRPGSPFDDDRVQPIALDPVVAVAGRHRPFDVIISNPGQSAVPSAGACFTAEFYRNAARQLAPDGIFCQRFQAIDYGPMPLAVLTRTMQTAFRTILFVQTAGGEYVLLGTNSERGLVPDRLVERLQAPQVRQVLAEVGWDWSMVLNLPAFDQGALADFAAESGTGINTADNGRLAFGLPQEIIRWAPKSQEVQSRLAHRGTRFLAWENVDGDDPDVLRRLAEVTGQRTMMTRDPDQYWAYRKAVREQITERPRPLIVPVKGDVVQELHPIDQRRLDYFAALGEAVRNHPPRPDDIRHVAEYAVPFDPLISYFLHEEVAQLYSRLPERDFEAELPHRLHAIYYADGQDRSVRNVAAALVLLAEHPQALPDPVARWDQLNGLFQMLQLRWQTRGAVPPKSSRIVLNDIEKSIAGVEAAFDAMDRLSREHDIPHANWAARRPYLERTLLRPLRTYRSQVLPHHLKRLRLLEKTGEDADAAPVPDADAPL